MHTMAKHDHCNFSRSRGKCGGIIAHVAAFSGRGTVGAKGHSAVSGEASMNPRLLSVAFAALSAALAAWFALAAEDTPKSKLRADRATIDNGRVLATLGNC